MAAVNISSDSDDDSVILVPYVKPQPPTIVLVDSDHEDLEDISASTDTSKGKRKDDKDHGGSQGDRQGINSNSSKKQQEENDKNRTISKNSSTSSSTPVSKSSIFSQRRDEASSGTNVCSDQNISSGKSKNTTISHEESNNSIAGSSCSRSGRIAQTSPSSIATTTTPSRPSITIPKLYVTKQKDDGNISSEKEAGTPKTPKTPRPSYMYTLTPAQKKKYPHLEKILNDLQKEKEKKRAQEARLKQLKNLQQVQKSTNYNNQASKKSNNKSSPKKKHTTIPSLTAADLDHLSFLKTLNLTAGIGFDEGEIRALGHATAKDSKKRRHGNNDKTEAATSTTAPLASTSSSASNVLKSNKAEPFFVDLTTSSSSAQVLNNDVSTSLPTSAQIRSVASETTTSAIPAPFVSIVDESLGKNTKSRSLNKKQQHQGRSPFNASPVSTTHSSPRVESPVEIEIIETTTTKTPTKLASEVNTVNNGEELSTEADDDDEGIFTHKELREIQSKIRLNITGHGGPPNPFLQSKDNADCRSNNSKEKRTPAFRYFENLNESRSVGNESSDGSTSSGEVQMEEDDNDSEIQDSQPRTNEVIQRQQKRPKRKPSKRRDEFSQSPNKRKKRGNNDDLPATDSDSESTRFDDQDDDLGRPVNHNRLSALPPNARSFPKTWNRKMLEFYGTIQKENLDLDDVFAGQSNASHLWRTPLDPGSRRRYGKQIKCHNCNQFGNHTANRCPEPRRLKICVMCGNVGHTTPCLYEERSNDGKSKQCGRFTITMCLQARCLNCGARNTLNNKGNTKIYSELCESCSSPSISYRNLKCQCCGLEGHGEPYCPDNWRRFHSTLVDPDVNTPAKSTELQTTVYKEKHKSYCANCGQQGHHYFHCRLRRDYNAHTPSKPYVIRELPLCLQQKSLEMVQETVKNSVATVVFTSRSQQRSVRRQEGGVFEVHVISDNNEQVGESGISEHTSASTAEVPVTVSLSGASSTSQDDDDVVIIADADTTTTTTIANPGDNRMEGEDHSIVHLMCSEFSDCTNSNASGMACHKIGLSRDEHTKVLQVDTKIDLITRLKRQSSHLDVSICLLQKTPQIHLCGRNYDDLRDKIFQLVYQLKSVGEEKFIESFLSSEKDSSTLDDQQSEQNNVKCVPNNNNNMATSSIIHSVTTTLQSDLSMDTLEDELEVTIVRTIVNDRAYDEPSKTKDVSSGSGIGGIVQEQQQQPPPQQPQPAAVPQPSNQTNNNKNNNTGGQNEPRASMYLTEEEWDILLPKSGADVYGSLEFLNSIRDECGVCILAEKDGFKISINNSTWGNVLQAKYKISKWLKLASTDQQNGGNAHHHGWSKNQQRRKFPNQYSPHNHSPRSNNHKKHQQHKRKYSHSSSRSPSAHTKRFSAQ